MWLGVDCKTAALRQRQAQQLLSVLGHTNQLVYDNQLAHGNKLTFIRGLSWLGVAMMTKLRGPRPRIGVIASHAQPLPKMPLAEAVKFAFIASSDPKLLLMAAISAGEMAETLVAALPGGAITCSQGMLIYS